MSGETTDLGLLLCDADERASVLAQGLPEAALSGAPAPERGTPGKDSRHLEALDRDPNDLAAQRWAVIALAGAAGDAALAAIGALVELDLAVLSVSSECVQMATRGSARAISRTSAP